jgi:tRNA threonylcarbamoyladenosine biosynthesis protein TsaB
VCADSEAAELAAESESVLLTGDGCEDLKAKYFANNENVKCTPFADRLQKASALCMAFEANPEYAVSADKLAAAYLQDTKAEKDKAHRGDL